MGLKSQAKHSLPAALTSSAPAHKHARTAKRSQSPGGGSGGAEPGGFCRCFPPSSAASSSCNTTLPSHGSSAAKASRAGGHTCKPDPKTRGKPPIALALQREAPFFHPTLYGGQAHHGHSCSDLASSCSLEQRQGRGGAIPLFLS